MRTALSDVLASERPGWRIIQARNGMEGVELARAHAPDLILLGGDLSVMSDFQAAQILRQMPQTESIPLIALTASLARSATAVALRTICDAVLCKPIPIQELMRTIDRTIGHHVRPRTNVERDTRLVSKGRSPCRKRTLESR